MSALEKIERWLNALEQFDPWQSCCDFYKQNEEQLVEMNRQQLSNMMTPEGDPITVLGAGEYGKVYDLYNTGAFYEGITITTDAEKIEFISTDTKWLNEVAPSPGYFMTMTPLVEWFGNVLGVPIQEQEIVDMATADYVADDFRKCFD